MRTGNRVAPRDVFTNLKRLAVKAKAAQKAEVEKSLKEIKSDPANKDYLDSIFLKTRILQRKISRNLPSGTKA